MNVNIDTTYSSSSNALLLALTLRLLQYWNPSGQQAIEGPYIASFLSSQPLLLGVSCILSYVTLLILLVGAFQHSKPVVAKAVVVFLIWASQQFKLLFTFNDSPELFAEGFKEASLRPMSNLPILGNLTFLCYLVWAGCLGCLALSYATFGPNTVRRRSLLLTLTVFLTHQTRATNIPLILGVPFAWHTLDIISDLNEANISLWTLLLSHFSFFAMGGTNSINTIDLSNAYNGISSFNPIPVGILLFISNWAGPVLCGFAGLIQQLDRNDQKPEPRGKWDVYGQHVVRMTVFMAISTLGIEIACYVLREHLFVWTVFSPKLLYHGAWVGWHFGVTVVGGALVTGLFA